MIIETIFSIFRNVYIFFFSILPTPDFVYILPPDFVNGLTYFFSLTSYFLPLGDLIFFLTVWLFLVNLALFKQLFGHFIKGLKYVGELFISTIKLIPFLK